jgi:hypothetical protein
MITKVGARLMNVDAGLVIYHGEVLEPPFVIRAESGTVYLEGQQSGNSRDVLLYPFPQTKPGPGVSLEEGFELPPEVRKAVDDALLDVTLYPGFGFDEKAKELERLLRAKGIHVERSDFYGDVLVPADGGWGIVALLNEEKRIEIAREGIEQHPVERTLPFDTATRVAEFIERLLKGRGVIILDVGVLIIIPRPDQLFEPVARINAQDVPEEQKVEEVTKGVGVSLDVGRTIIQVVTQQGTPVPQYDARLGYDAVIFFPHHSWQRGVYGRASEFPTTLVRKLTHYRFVVRFYFDEGVTLSRWRTVLSHEDNNDGRLLVIYNQGHGNENRILTYNDRYVTSGFVIEHAKLRYTLVDVHSCLTLASDRLANAFLEKGAADYCGWKESTSADPDYCDCMDRAFWSPLLDLWSTVEYAHDQAAEMERKIGREHRNFKFRGDPDYRLPRRRHPDFF